MIHFKQEISVIRETLQQQQRVLVSLGRYSPGFSASDAKEDGDGVRRLVEDYYRRHEPRSLRHIYSHHRGGRAESDEEAPYARDRGHHITQINEIRKSPTSELSPTDPNGLQGLLILDSLALLEKRIREFKELNDQVSDLEIWVSLRSHSSCGCVSSLLSPG